MDMELITKRLLISGLTPAISSDDLSRRIGTFGSVTALDGLGKPDALGQPRKFAHVTLETTKTQLSRCMNVLSGSTWKGAKLRIGEAKPDFRERILLENASSGEQPPRKRQRLAHGVQGKHAQDMSLVTSENVHLRPQWCVTPLGRLIRPMRMRPAHPLGPPIDAFSKAAQQSSGLTLNRPNQKKAKARKKRVPPTRARRQMIDPLRWGSTHLSGVFLDGGSALPSTSALVAHAGPGTGTNGESTEVEADEEVEEILDAAQGSVDDHDGREMIPHSVQASPRLSSSIVVGSTSADLAAEKTRTLQLLHSMFGETNEDWGCAERTDSDMEQVAAESHANAVPNASQSLHGAITDFEVVPAAQRRGDDKSSADRTTTVLRNHEPEPAPAQPSSTTTLKDLFAPREDEGFSLIGHLDLDSELDLDLDEPAFTNNAPPTTTTPTSIRASDPSAAAPAPARSTQQAKGLDATLPFFFPYGSHALAKGQHLVRGAVKFRRTEDEAQIRVRWEAVRGELTREWKRRHREAVKSRRRRGGGGTGGERAE